MATPSSLTTLHVPGADANAVTVDGTAIGLLKEVELRRTTRRALITAEEFGGEVVDELWSGVTYRLGMLLRGWDADAIKQFFLNTSNSRVNWPGTAPIGHLRSRDAVAVVFTPRDSTLGPQITFNAAIPEVAEELTIAYAKRTEHLMAVSFLALRDSATPASSVSWGP